MGCKTVLMQILTRYGVMSSAMQTALQQDTDDRVEAEVAANANQTPVTIPTEFVEPDKPAEPSEPEEVEEEAPPF